MSDLIARPGPTAADSEPVGQGSGGSGGSGPTPSGTTRRGGLARSALAGAAAAIRALFGRLRSHTRPDRPSADNRRYTFEAFVTVLPPDGSPLAVQPGPDWHGVIRSATGSLGSSSSLFSAQVASWDQHNAGRAGAAQAVATIVAFGAKPADSLPVGGTFALWRGHDVGHGVVTRRIFV